MVDLATAMPWYLVSGVMTSVVSGPFIDIVKFLTNNHAHNLLRRYAMLRRSRRTRGRGSVWFMTTCRHVSYCCKTDFWMGMLFVVTKETFSGSIPTNLPSINKCKLSKSWFIVWGSWWYQIIMNNPDCLIEILQSEGKWLMDDDNNR